MEFRSDGIHQHSLFRVVLCVLPQPERRQTALGCRAAIHRKRRCAARGSSESRERGAVLVSTPAAESLRIGAGIRRLQLYVLPALDLVALLFSSGPARRFVA